MISAGILSLLLLFVCLLFVSVLVRFISSSLICDLVQTDAFSDGSATLCSRFCVWLFLHTHPQTHLPSPRTNSFLIFLFVVMIASSFLLFFLLFLPFVTTLRLQTAMEPNKPKFLNRYASLSLEETRIAVAKAMGWMEVCLLPLFLCSP